MDRRGTPFLIFVAGALPIAGPAHSAGASGMALTQGWAIQSSADVREGGAAVSTVGYRVEDWYPATVPSTVLAALVAQHVYPDPFPGMNLRSIAGTAYPPSDFFTGFEMPPESPFRHSRWYRTEFDLAAGYKGKTLTLPGETRQLTAIYNVKDAQKNRCRRRRQPQPRGKATGVEVSAWNVKLKEVRP